MNKRILKERANNPAPPFQVQTLTLEAVLSQSERDFNDSLTNIRYRLSKLKEMMG
jgi:hypothetical protein